MRNRRLDVPKGDGSPAHDFGWIRQERVSIICRQAPRLDRDLRPRVRGLRSLRSRRREDRVVHASTIPTNDLTYQCLIRRGTNTKALGGAYTRLKRIRSAHPEQRS
jgi:hypothetical protein